MEFVATLSRAKTLFRGWLWKGKSCAACELSGADRFREWRPNS